MSKKRIIRMTKPIINRPSAQHPRTGHPAPVPNKKNPVNYMSQEHLMKDPKYRNLNIVSKIEPAKKDKVFIIGGGPSLKRFNFSLLDGHDVIAVNKAIESYPTATYFVTMDYTFFGKTISSIDLIKSRGTKTYFVINQEHPYIQRINGVITDTRNNLQYLDLYKMDYLVPSKQTVDASTGFGTNVDSFAHGSNSGYCAIQLALLMGYKEIHLLGFDMGASRSSHKSPLDTHFHNGYRQSPSQFAKNLEGYKNNLITSISKYPESNRLILSTPGSALGPQLRYDDINEAVGPRPATPQLKSAPVQGLQNLMIVAYYTLGTPYEKEAQKLTASLKRLNLQHDVVGVKNLGNWQANTRFKAQFMLDMLDKHKGKNLLYIDADAIVHSRPVLFENYPCDVAVRWQDFRWRQNECLSGTIFMANNDKTRKLCKIWQNTNNAEGPDAKTFEQWNLGTAIQQMKKTDGLIDKNLPPEYTFIFDSMKKLYPNARPVIEHFQASRKLRNKI